ncbi:protein BIG GRAIN 1-like D [Brassica rapa]|uniref:Uncharacterized protein n=1 Tax=Brassica campestris TaxID=3711 RepID=A0A3P6D9Z5_BRACM|nr:protein BIG GRAIN 1-like D [Brassica rapa]CAG7911437.1 unnamed protein product [Brassica rapa]VDD19941.1 unnamed protein product [Brassica rapa]
MHRSRNPSFSSTLLDEIYNSIDHKTHKTQSFTGFVNTTNNKQSISVTRPVPDRKIHKDRFFSSVSSSSDSNSSFFSSSDTEPSHAKKKSSSRPLCFGPSKTTKPRKTEDKTLFHQNRAFRVSEDYDYEKNEHTRTRRSSSNQKKLKTPASPGVRIVNFINSLFSSNNSSKGHPKKMSCDDSAFVRKPNDYYYPSTTCSSASSFSRSCLNKSSEKSSDRVKRSVRFSPVNVIVPESRSYVEEEDYLSNNGYVRKSVKKNVEDRGRRSVEEIAREFLRDYHKKHDNGLVKINAFEDYEDDDDDVASDSSSDLFELDLVGTHHHNLYGDELPVYETTFAGLIL